MSLALFCGWVGALLGVVMTAVQLRRAHREGPAGISTTTWSLFFSMNIFWLVYGAALHSGPMIYGTIAIIPVQAGVLATLDRRDVVRAMTIGLATVSLFVLLPSALWGWKAGALSVGAIMVVTRWPQIKELVVNPTVIGVSVPSWIIGSINLSVWLLYYLGTHQGAAALSMFAAIVANLAIVALALIRQRTTFQLSHFARTRSAGRSLR